MCNHLVFTRFNMCQVPLLHSERSQLRKTCKVEVSINIYQWCAVNTHVPILSAPAKYISLHFSNDLMPAEAFTFTPSLYATVFFISNTSSAAAPPPRKPVHVFTKVAPASAAMKDAAIFSSSVRKTVSRITLRGIEFWHVDATRAMSL